MIAILTNDGYIALLDAVYFEDLLIGNISEEGIDWTGEDSQSIEIWAAQLRSAPVKKLQTRAATDRVEGKLIELKAQNLQTLIGGTIDAEGGWHAPATTTPKEGKLKILAGTGQTIEIPRASLLLANIRGGLGQDKTLGVQFAFEKLVPLDMSSPMSIYMTKPFIDASPKKLTFDKAGGTQTVSIVSSGPFAPSDVPAGFSVGIDNGKVTITAAANSTSSSRGGTMSFSLVSDPTIKVEIELSQTA